MLTSNYWNLQVGSWSPSSKRWALQIGCQIPKFNLPEDGFWNPTYRRWKLYSNFEKFEVRSFGDDIESRGHLSQYFFRAKTCVKTRKTVVLEAENRLEETPVGNRGDP